MEVGQGGRHPAGQSPVGLRLSGLHSHSRGVAEEKLPVDLSPPHYSDHRAFVVRMWDRGLKRCAREQETFPVQPPTAGERSEEKEDVRHARGRY